MDIGYLFLSTNCALSMQVIEHIKNIEIPFQLTLIDVDKRGAHIPRGVTQTPTLVISSVPKLLIGVDIIQFLTLYGEHVNKPSISNNNVIQDYNPTEKSLSTSFSSINENDVIDSTSLYSNVHDNTSIPTPQSNPLEDKGRSTDDKLNQLIASRSNRTEDNENQNTFVRR